RPQAPKPAPVPALPEIEPTIGPTAAPFAAPFPAAPVAAESTWAAAAAPAALGSFIDVDVMPACSAPHFRHSYSSVSCCAAVWPFAGKTTMPSFCLASFIVMVCVVAVAVLVAAGVLGAGVVLDFAASSANAGRGNE